ncbi:hypothetical protein CC1G_00004 [Coprinopsis cinerea okayama7|uniref:Uncharacterized protein n=1 Tax=Coprinopsis cinerea (strain Okayama-7 / 130 / ATCC MYA-4618 / FGSC 9003) TaxID=240176 RepID=A8NWD7_COPC7|nr:hypothetical protein CC1G_00004 [Coprinopsis cinerea okayama7\|eukprot:XP_001836868.2 hypothetical protein CC1G_00004 [Coprinopsis cinerea okayama7\
MRYDEAKGKAENARALAVRATLIYGATVRYVLLTFSPSGPAMQPTMYSKACLQ